MSARNRASTPGAYVRRQDPPVAAAAIEKVKGGNVGISPRRPTDVCCSVVLVLFTVALVMFNWNCQGDMRRVIHGFDFRGNLCGVARGERAKGNFVYWCSGDNGSVQWDKPTCVWTCPKFGWTVDCPTGDVEIEETQSPRASDGRIVISTITKYTVVHAWATNTTRFQNFCFPDVVRPLDFVQVIASHSRTWLGHVLTILLQIVELQQAPRLLISLAMFAVVASYAWLLALRIVARWLVHIMCVVSILGFVSAGIVSLLIPAELLEAKDLLRSLQAEQQGDLVTAGLFALVTRGKQFGLLGIFAQALPAFARIVLGLALLIGGLVMLVWYSFAKESINVSADSVSEATRIAFSKPTLLFVLPILTCALRLAVLFATGAGVLRLLSSSEVQHRPVSFLGVSVAGIFRQFDLSGWLIAGILGWLFAFLWYYELISAFSSYVLSCTVAQLYFVPRGASTTRLPILVAARSALLYHFGSLALGALVMACLRALCVVAKVLHKVVYEKEAPRSVRCLLGLFDTFLELCRTIAERVNDATYTDIAITSQSYSVASARAAGIMLRHTSTVMMQNMIIRPITYFGGLVYAAAIGVCVHMLLTPAAIRLLDPDLPADNTFCESPVILSFWAAFMCFFMVLSFTAIVNSIADAVLYCFFWDIDDGALDADSDRIPASFKNYLKISLGNQLAKKSA